MRIKKVLRVISIFLIMAMLFTLIPELFGINDSRASASHSVHTTTIIPGRTYYIRVKHSGQYLDANASTGNVAQWGFHGGANQQWLVVASGINDSQGRPTYYLRNVHTNRALNVTGTGDTDGLNVNVVTQSNNIRQQFAIARNNNIANPDDSFRIVPRFTSSRVIDVSGGGNNVGRLHLWGWHTGTNQRFYFEEVDYTGFAIFRDGVIGQNVNLNWHAGLMDAPRHNSSTLPVFHMRGPGHQPSRDTWNNFLTNPDVWYLGGGLNTYMGVYRPRFHMLTPSNQVNFRTKARDLNNRSITYTFATLLTLRSVPFPQPAFLNPHRKLEPSNIRSIRCDGVIEYVYEYFGYRVGGSNSIWDISNEYNVANHEVVMPTLQANFFLAYVTYNLPGGG